MASAVVSRMESDLYHRAGLDVKLTLDQPLSMTEFEKLSAAMEKRILRPLALLAMSIRDPSRPWLQRKLLKIYDGMSVQDALPKFCPIAKRTKGNKDERLWKMIEFKLVNDEVCAVGRNELPRPSVQGARRTGQTVWRWADRPF